MLCGGKNDYDKISPVTNDTIFNMLLTCKYKLQFEAYSFALAAN